MNPSTLTFGFALLATVCAPICASAATLPPQALTVSPFSSTSLNAPADFVTNAINQFNPSLGTLTSVTATIGGSALWNVTALGISPPSDTLSVQLFTGGNNPFQNQTTFSTGPQSVTVNLTDTFSSLLYVGTGTLNLLVEFADSIGENSISSANGLSGSITYTYTPAATPLPATLPLFATGLGGLGLLGLCRKRKGQAIA